MSKIDYICSNPVRKTLFLPYHYLTVRLSKLVIMFKKLRKLFSDFFGTLFGKENNDNSESSTSQAFDKLPGLLEDSSDIPDESTVSTIRIAPIPPVPPYDPFADPDKTAATENTGSNNSSGNTISNASGGANTGSQSPGGSTATGGTSSAGGSSSAGSSTSSSSAGGATTPVKPAHKAKYLWCLDNGHGKLQPGKRSPLLADGTSRFFEYEFNRDIVERIKKALDKKGVKYFDVVPDYLTVGSFLPERVDRANKKVSDLPKIYLSVHSNAGPSLPDQWVADDVNGIETWYAEGSTKGKKIATIFQQQLIAYLGWKNRNIKSTTQTSLYVLLKTTMPAILTENGFYNNKKEVLELMKPSVRQIIADAHVAAIMQIEKEGI
jgi:N-acetylmuramoyl-L-alanine amidase